MNGLSDFLQHNHYILNYMMWFAGWASYHYVVIVSILLFAFIAEFFLVKRLAVGASFFKVLMVVIAMNVAVIFVVPFISWWSTSPLLWYMLRKEMETDGLYPYWFIYPLGLSIVEVFLSVLLESMIAKVFFKRINMKALVFFLILINGLRLFTIPQLFYHIVDLMRNFVDLMRN